MLGQNVRQNLDQAVHVGFFADKRRQETQRVGTSSVNHGAGGQRAGNNIMRIARSVIQISSPSGTASKRADTGCSILAPAKSLADKSH